MRDNSHVRFSAEERTRRGLLLTQLAKVDMLLGRDDFLARLTSDFPEIVGQINQYETGLLHCEIAAFRRATEQAIDGGRLWEVEKHFRLIEELLPIADSELLNALEVAYLEDFALGECTPERYRAVKERMPKSLRKVLISHHPNWQ